MKSKKKNSQRIWRIKRFTDKYSWEGINYPSEKINCKIFEKNNLTIAFIVLYAKKEKMQPVSKQIIIIIYPDLESLTKKIDRYKTNLKNHLQQK